VKHRDLQCKCFGVSVSSSVPLLFMPDQSIIVLLCEKRAHFSLRIFFPDCIVRLCKAITYVHKLAVVSVCIDCVSEVEYYM
jgi:hypothetical protein